ncbi:MAG: diguanylate cyclase [Myxococcales bacterium]|nr:diguanylate cyclase [Myxococcales bacterium]|tara:strand:- start:201 stop:779 length:579 start_codon:yes stop_codon:yes gene_type:complete
MSDQQTADLVLSLILYVLLPLWGIAGFVDWCCHRASKIEETSGLKESFIHALMGAQVGFPIILGLVFEVNILILFIIFLVLITHELVAHWDVHFTAPRREITIWEVHAHNYLATIPFYLTALIMVRKWDVVTKMISFEWAGQFGLEFRAEPIGGTPYYLPYYLSFMLVICILPYFEEMWRCYRYQKQKALRP